jgi:predicted GTPase
MLIMRLMRLGKILKSGSARKSIWLRYVFDMSTPVLTRILKEATTAHQPPIVNTRRIKLKYAHQRVRNPPIVVVHGVQTDALTESYKRFDQLLPGQNGVGRDADIDSVQVTG